MNGAQGKGSTLLIPDAQVILLIYETCKKEGQL